MTQGRDLTLGLIGAGYWGPNLMRAAAELDGVQLAAVCDRDLARLQLARRRDPRLKTTAAVEDIVGDEAIDAVLIATPISSHHALALRCLRAGKHVFVEKPMAQTSVQCLDLPARDALVRRSHDADAARHRTAPGRPGRRPCRRRRVRVATFVALLRALISV